jgi:hypothetical protein
MVRCVVYACSNHSEKKSGISFHLFPKEEPYRQAWVNFCRRDKWRPRKTSVMCSKHFLIADFEVHPPTFKSRGYDNAKAALFSWAVPTQQAPKSRDLLSPSNVSLRRSPRKSGSAARAERMAQKVRKEVTNKS